MAQLDGILLSVPRKDDEEGKTWLRRSKRVPRQVNSVQIPWWPPQDSYARPHAFQDEAGHTHSDPHVLGYMARQNGGFGARMSRQLSLFFFFCSSLAFMSTAIAQISGSGRRLLSDRLPICILRIVACCSTVLSHNFLNSFGNN